MNLQVIYGIFMRFTGSISCGAISDIIIKKAPPPLFPIRDKQGGLSYKRGLS